MTTNGDGDEASLSVISIAGRRVAGVTRTHFPPEQLEAIVRESEAACARRPEAPDYMPLLPASAAPAGWHDPPADADIHVFDPMRVCDGIEPSDDPILHFRRKAYDVSARGRWAG